MIDFSFLRGAALAGSLIPGAIIILILLRAGERRFAPRLLWLAILCGAMISILPFTATTFAPLVAQNLRDAFSIDMVKAFGFAGLSEEGFKLLACVFLIRPYFLRRTGADLILACAGVGLGFALQENIFYVMRGFDHWQAVALSRALTSVPIHSFLGLIMGALLALAAMRTRWARVFLILGAWFIPAALHGLYDLPLFLAEEFPLSPIRIGELAAFLSIDPQTLTACMLLAACALISLFALASLALCPRLTDRSGPVFPLGPWPVVDKLLFAPDTGVILGAGFTLCGAAELVIGVAASLSGAVPVTLLLLASTGVILFALGLALGGPQLRVYARNPVRILSVMSAGAQRLHLPGEVGVAVAAVGFVALVYSGYYGLRIGVANALTSSGATQLDSGQTAGALDNFSAALEWRENYFPAQLGRSAAYQMLQRYDDAMAALDQAVQLNPENPGAFAARAQIHRVKHEFKSAIEDLNQAISLDSETPEFLVLRGSARMDDGDVEGARKDAAAAARIAPNLTAIHSLLAQIALLTNDPESALNESSFVLKREPANGGLAFLRGRLYFAKGDYAAAVKDFQSAMKNGERGYIALWLFLAENRMGEDGRKNLAMWAGVMPQNAWPFPLVKFYLGAEAIQNVDAAAKTNDQKCEFYFYMAEALLLGQLEEKATTQAIKLFERAHAICPKDFIEYDASRQELEKLKSKTQGADAQTTPPPPFKAPVHP